MTVETWLPEARLTVNWLASSIEPPIAPWAKQTVLGALVTTQARWTDVVSALAWCFRVAYVADRGDVDADPAGEVDGTFFRAASSACPRLQLLFELVSGIDAELAECFT